LIQSITLGVLTATSVLLFAFGMNLLYLTWRAMRLRPPLKRPLVAGDEPGVCVQLPIYNERYVAERVLDATCALDWPRDRLEVQILDDSDDETSSILARRASHWRDKGIEIAHVRRGAREGFKAGALAHGMTLTRARFIAIFDADFVPPADFLRRTIGAFDDPSVAFAQARWGHLDEGFSWFTRLQALAIDFHFLVEQSVRSARGYFTNFTGTAGVWRREAIVDAGGWSADTLTEDLDLSYRAQLRGWKAAYLEGVVVPEELPVSIDAYRRQQSRWATGSFQSASKLFGPLLRSRHRPAVKLQAAVHLLAYGVGPLMVLQLMCYPVLLIDARRVDTIWLVADASVALAVIAVSPWFGFMVAQTRRGRPWWTGIPSFMCQVFGAGMSLNTTIALTRATRRGGVFVRTPKHRIEQRGQQWRDQAYVRAGDARVLLEVAFGAGALAIVPVAIGMGHAMLAVYAALFGLGFFVVAGLSVVEFLQVVSVRRTLVTIRAGASLAVLLVLAGVLLVVAAQLPEPFEDGYGHWLIAANLASSGLLHDPLFGMEDTWLVGYHLLAGAVLHVFGVWQLGALKVLSAMLALATLACVYALAPNRRQGTLAVALLALNPIFLFTSGSAVVEPLLTTLLTGAGLAAVRGRMKVASLLAGLAAVTATKAWIWIAAVVALAVFERLMRRSAVRERIPGIAWATPAIALLVSLQLGFAPASHSVARGAVEVVSATSRGSIPAGPLARLLELIANYGLATLPLLAFGLIGIFVAARGHGGSMWRFVYGPSLVYVTAVLGLVATGAYTGSHRYLYPALPPIALLAAAALDRYAAVVRVAAVGATAILAIAYLPVFASFAAGNAGLVAAGKAVAGSPGVLVTDSPVVAYYSGKPLSQIAGSMALPRERGQAIQWMRANGVTDLVLEDISYYPATAVFPDLASGKTSPPFQPIGEQRSYQVFGGKPVYAYRLPPSLLMESTSQGKTARLAKGVTLGAAATGEGMGFGVPAVHYRDGWVYSRTAATVHISDHVWKRTFELDEAGGDATRGGYAWFPIQSRGQIEVTYSPDARGVSVDVRPVWLAPGYIEVGILNEGSAAFDDFADQSQTLVGMAFGPWVEVHGPWARLRAGSLGVEWSLPQLSGAQLHAGRELKPPDFNWAGLDYTFPGSFAGASYRITFQEAR
jgi:cellulose synthase/poly-beta-1,6-N-acetylglucosamine synthase-like glycosyltransferase